MSVVDAVRVVLFDAVGTLMYPHPPVAEVYLAAGRRFGSQLGEGEIERRFRRAFSGSLQDEPTDADAELRRWRRIVAEVFDDATDVDGLFAELWQHFARASAWRLFEDVEPALARLVAEGLALGIASNFDDRLFGIVAGLPPLAACRHTFVSSDIGWSKPDPRFFAEVQRRLDLPAGAILLIGDDPDCDHNGAARAGWCSLLLDRSGRRPGPHVIRSLDQITQA